jgi:cytidylate kinase
VTDLLVTMDGPAGTGKSTVSRAVARALGVPHLDTGAFYRVAGLIALRSGVELDDEEQVVNAISGAALDQVDGHMFLDGVDVSDQIRSPEATTASSRVSAHPAVRKLLVEEQRDWVARHGNRAVVEGRDIGSVVFPDATLKVYLDARPEVRARRRSLQTGEEYETILSEIRDRDHRDSTRDVSPLTVPLGAVVVDTTDMAFEEVVDAVVGMARARSG